MKLEPLGWPLVRLALVIVLGGVAPLIDTTIVNVALPAVAADFGVGPTAIQWVATGYLLALGVAIPVTSWATSRFGASRLWPAGLAVFLVGSALSGLSWNLDSLIAFRVLQGVGAGVLLPVLQTILVRAAGPAKTARLLTIVMLVSVLAPIAGPLVGGAIVTGGSWRWLFVINVPLCLAAIVLARRFVPVDSPLRGSRLDLPGLSLLAPAVVLLLLALTDAASGNGFVVPLGAGVVLLGGFVAWSLRRGERALIPLRLFANRAFSASAAVLFLTGLALYGALFLIPLYFEQERGLGAFAAGMILALQGVGSLLTRWVGGVVDRVGARVIAVAGIAGCAAATVPFAVAGPSTSLVVLGAALVVRGGALSAANIAITSAAFTRLSREDVPAGSAVVRLVQQLGGSAGTAVLASVAATGAFAAAFLVSAALAVAALVPAFLLGRRELAGIAR
ncbi:DHA2 family efflux MFS transporter permease subunit [Amycolatopsis rhabdoformis]|uniref:DHA2 family efflux MFS transporter permease subunit n=1 Tax=Amycolatopsis rhabdoformis TaxID=1448059 RepID=A0ABZ1I3V4_9PSEU|nr:DHA2 family efflux MFS transporter permease subunit [Amycolatopsis rhabdoformis]WSE29070.1 DHA2 family efflux MFS transporter permease subunit [Amycolatopsis rhabdoformis]